MKPENLYCNSVISTAINESIIIHEGEFHLVSSDTQLKVVGEISFKWLPRLGLTFRGEAELITETFDVRNTMHIKVGQNLLGEFYFTKVDMINLIVAGVIIKVQKLGDVAKGVSKISFSLPNFSRHIIGSVCEVQGFEERDEKFILNDEQFQAVIVRKYLDKYALEILRGQNEIGGYSMIHVGEVRKLKCNFTKNEVVEYFDCLNAFISFVNGRRISALFLRGQNAKNSVWEDFSPSENDAYVGVLSCFFVSFIPDLNSIWNNFRKLWSNKSDRNFIETGFQWYMEANKFAGRKEGSIIMVQTALELVCNWILIEKGKVLHGSDEKLSAASKIRILLTIMGVSLEIPLELKHLTSAIKDRRQGKNEYSDGPGALTSVRNMLTHFNVSKMYDYKNLPESAVRDVRKLGLWYLEVAFLCIFGYKGEYYNRCKDATERMPFNNFSI